MGWRDLDRVNYPDRRDQLANEFRERWDRSPELRREFRNDFELFLRHVDDGKRRRER
jgi:hypothetical protein